MDTEVLFVISIFSSVAQFAGIGYFLWQVYKGLKTQIQSLHTTVDIQKKTLEAMELRISETEKFKDLYKHLINELPEDLEKYRKVLSAVKDDVIKELEEANNRKDEKLKKISQIRLDEINELDNLLRELPKIKDNMEILVQTQNSIREKLEMFEPSKPIGKFFAELELWIKEKERDLTDDLNLLETTEAKIIVDVPPETKKDNKLQGGQ